MPSHRNGFQSGVMALAVTLSVVCGACAPSENSIREAARAQLQANPVTAPLALSIEVKNRVVYLSGKTATPEEQEQALTLVRAVRGVKVVVNDMWLNDAGLAEKVKAALAADAMVGKVPIEVDAQDGHVRLMSDQTNREERARIVEIASAVEGVKDVQDRMK